MNQEFETYDASDQLKMPGNTSQDTSSISGVVFNERKKVSSYGNHGIIIEWIMRSGMNEKAAKAMLIILIVILFALTIMVISKGNGAFLPPRVIQGAI